jgi:hypothetical protein
MKKSLRDPDGRAIGATRVLRKLLACALRG